MPANRTDSLLPVLSLLLSATMWGLIWYPLRFLEAGGLQGEWQALVLYAAATVVALPVLPAAWRALRGRPVSLSVMALASGWCNLAFMLAVLQGSVVRALLLFYMSPLWAVLLGRLLLGERLAAEGVLVLVVAVSGAAVMLWDPAIGLPWPHAAADWLALSSGFAFALSNVEVRRLQAVPVKVKTVLSWLGCVVIAAVSVRLLQVPLPPVAPEVWWAAALLGVLGITTMTLAVQYGVTHMPVQRSAVILLFEIVVGAVSSQLLANETLQPREWLGGVMIITAGLLAAHREMRA